MFQWTADYSTLVDRSMLILTHHARVQMQRRHVSTDDLLYVIHHGTRVHRKGRVYYSLRRRDLDATASRSPLSDLVGTTVVMCPISAVVITVYRDRKGAMARLKRKPKRAYS